MSKRPSVSQALALKVAAAAAAQDDEEDAPAPSAAAPEPAKPSAPPADTGKPRGRPRGRRAIEARQTVYLDKDRHAALARLAEDRGRSIHSLIIEGIDMVTHKPTKAAWD